MNGNVTVHPTALVGPEVEIGAGTEVGPFCRFEGRTRIGRVCRFSVGVVVGAPPMDREYQGEPTGVVVGDGNEFHEYVTVHRSTGTDSETVLGHRNRVMAYVHIAHNCRIGSDCTITNGVQLAGYSEVGDRATIGGLTGVHQYCRIGALAMVGACSYVNKDIPPYVVAAGNPIAVRGVNSIGLERAGLAGTVVAALKQAFRILYRSDLNLSQALVEIDGSLLPHLAAGKGREQVATLVQFIGSSKRGIELRTSTAGGAAARRASAARQSCGQDGHGQGGASLAER